MKLIDLSHPMVDGQPAWPGDPPLEIKPAASTAFEGYNTTRVRSGTHQGTHLDAMFHFYADGRTVDQMPLEWFYGSARVLRLPRGPREWIDLEHLKPFEPHLKPGARIILATGWYRQFGRPEYFHDSPELTLEAARYLADRRIRLLGMDLPSPSREAVRTHHVLLAPEVEIVLVENLTGLDELPDEFVFIGFPLNFQGRDGSPIRAVALCP